MLHFSDDLVETEVSTRRAIRRMKSFGKRWGKDIFITLLGGGGVGGGGGSGGGGWGVGGGWGGGGVGGGGWGWGVGGWGGGGGGDMRYHTKTHLKYREKRFSSSCSMFLFCFYIVLSMPFSVLNTDKLPYIAKPTDYAVHGVIAR